MGNEAGMELIAERKFITVKRFLLSPHFSQSQLVRATAVFSNVA